MRTTVNGYKVPQDGDPGHVWSDAIEDNFDKVDSFETRVNNLNVSDITREVVNLDKALWVVDADGKGWKQIVSTPTGITLDKVQLRFRVTSGPSIHKFIHPTVQPLSLTAFEVIVNDSTLDLEILFL